MDVYISRCCSNYSMIELVIIHSLKTPNYGHWSTGTQPCSPWWEEGRGYQHPCRKHDLRMVLEEINDKCWEGNIVVQATRYFETWEAWNAEIGTKWEMLPAHTIWRAHWSSMGRELKQEFRGADLELSHQIGGGELPPPRSIKVSNPLLLVNTSIYF